MNPRLAHLLSNPRFAKTIVVSPEASAAREAQVEAVESWQRQRAVRDSLFLLTTVARENRSGKGEARVRNLSTTGLMAECKVMLRPGERVLFALRGVGEVSGCVVWAKGPRVGVAFDREIDPRLARKAVGNDPGKGIPFYVRYLGHSVQNKRT
jgi:hypothetical protein